MLDQLKCRVPSAYHICCPGAAAWAVKFENMVLSTLFSATQALSLIHFVAQQGHSHLEFLVQDSSKEVQHNEVGVGTLPGIPTISQQTGHQHKLLYPSFLGCIYQM